MTTPITRLQRAVAVVSITAGGLSTVLLAGLPIVSLVTSLICAVLATFRHVRTVAGRIGLVIVVVAAAGILIAAGFETDPINTAVDAYTQAWRWHLLGASLDLSPLALVVAHSVRDVGQSRPICLVVAHSVRNAQSAGVTGSRAAPAPARWPRTGP